MRRCLIGFPPVVRWAALCILAFLSSIAAGATQAQGAVSFSVTAPSTAIAGTPVAITVKALISPGVTATGYTGIVRFTSTDGLATLPANTTLTRGVKTVHVTFKTAGSRTVTATDTVTPAITGKSGAIVVKPAGAARFVVTAPSTATAGKAIDVKLTTHDAYGNVATGYAGTVHWTSSDTAAVLPANTKLTGGVGAFRVGLETAGNQTVTATDTVASAVTGTSNAIMVTGGSVSNSIYSIPASSIPAPTGKGVITFRILNGTNGAYPDNEVYWAVLGIDPTTNNFAYLDLSGSLQPITAALNNAPGHLTLNGVNYANIFHTVAQATWVSLPLLRSARIYLSVGTPCYIRAFDRGYAGPSIDNPTDPNRNVFFDFTEFTLDTTGYHGNTTRVDMFGLPIQHRVVDQDGDFDYTVGELESETRSGLFTEYSNEVPTEFQSLATVEAPYRIVGPLHGSFDADGVNANYFAGYTTVSTQDIIAGTGGAAQPEVCADLNRHVTAADSGIAADYYQAAPANFYSAFWHRHAIDGLAYGFPYDDFDGHAAYLSVANPKGFIVRVGW